MVPYITVAESTLPSHTVTFVTLVGSGFAMGELVLSLEAYLVRDWQQLTVKHLRLFWVEQKAFKDYFD